MEVCLRGRLRRRFFGGFVGVAAVEDVADAFLVEGLELPSLAIARPSTAAFPAFMALLLLVLVLLLLVLFLALFLVEGLGFLWGCFCIDDETTLSISFSMSARGRLKLRRVFSTMRPVLSICCGGRVKVVALKAGAFSPLMTMFIMK